MSRNDEDWELLERTSAADTSAYSQLVTKYYGSAVSFCFQILGDHQRAEDVVQKGFVNIFQARDRYERRAKFKTFLFKVLLNLCINELNRKKVPTTLSGLVEEDSAAESLFADVTAPDPARTAESEEALEMIRRGVMRLPPKHRAALYLREYLQLSYLDIAEALEASLNEVKIWIYRGRHRLQQILKPYLERGERIS